MLSTLMVSDWPGEELQELSTCTLAAPGAPTRAPPQGHFKGFPPESCSCACCTVQPDNTCNMPGPQHWKHEACTCARVRMWPCKASGSVKKAPLRSCSAN